MSEGHGLRGVGAAVALAILAVAFLYKVDRLIDSAEADSFPTDSMPNGVWSPPYYPPAFPTYVVGVPPMPTINPVYTVVVTVPSFPPTTTTMTLPTTVRTYAPPTMPSVPPVTVLTIAPPTVPVIPPTTVLTYAPPTVPTMLTPLPTFSALELVEALAYTGDADCIIDHAMTQNLGVREIAQPDILTGLVSQCAEEQP